MVEIQSSMWKKKQIVRKKKKKKKKLELFVSASRHWYTGEFSTMSVIVFVDAETQYFVKIRPTHGNYRHIS